MNCKAIYNAKVYLGQGRFAGAVLIRDESIAAVGTEKEVREASPAGTVKVDGCGGLLLPGFHDSHLHLQWVGRREDSIEAAGARSVEEVIERGRAFIAARKPAPGTYIQGAGVNPSLFTGEKRDLTRYDLDAISTENPIILSRHCGHTIYCNSAALEKAGFSERAPKVEGGSIDVDDNGRPTGVFRENANALLRAPMPPPTDEEIKRHISLGMRKAAALGITSAGSYDSSGPDFSRVMGVYKAIYNDPQWGDEWGEPGAPPRPRITAQCGISCKEEYLDFFLREGFITGKILAASPGGAPLLTMGPLKLFADGTLGGQTAWMREPYRDKPSTRGFPVIEEALFRRFVRKADEGGLQVVVHAIGDAAIAFCLDAFEEVTAPGRNPRRHGIIHCQITTPDLIERMARNGILALVQPIFLADDRAILESRVGPALAASSYAWGSMERAGAPVSYGTDAPVSPLDPLECIHWAVNRPGGREASLRERVPLAAAIESYTAGSAYSSFHETVMGRVAPGFLADLTLLDRDIFSTPPEEIPRAKALQTWIGGAEALQGGGGRGAG